MDFNDFAEEFDTVYVCRNYTKEQGWNTIMFDDKWAGEYAEGLPNAKNKGAKMEKNPQYGLTINGPGKGFVLLRLKDKLSPHQSKQYGYMTV
jgi:hypothetical protein